MKLRSTLLYSLLAVTIVLFISSCSTTVDIAKRHYNSGFYVDISSKKTNAVKNTVQAKPDEAVPVSAKAEGDPVALVTNSEQAIPAKKDEVKNESTPSYEPMNKKEKVSKMISSKPGLLANIVKMSENKTFITGKSSRLEASQSSDSGNKYLKLWLICLLAAIVLSAVGAWFIAWLAWIAFIVFFILWLINI